jgi:hypothetical protein
LKTATNHFADRKGELLEQQKSIPGRKGKKKINKRKRRNARGAKERKKSNVFAEEPDTNVEEEEEAPGTPTDNKLIKHSFMHRFAGHQTLNGNSGFVDQIAGHIV